MTEQASEKVKIKLGGMTCASCALKIETKLKNMRGVKSSNVNFANEEATVEYDAKTTNYREFDNAIRDLGYKASLAKMDIKVLDDLREDEFTNLVKKCENIKGIESIRGNYDAKKLFIEFNELRIGENEIYSTVKKFGYNIEKAASAYDKEVEAHKQEMKYRLRILVASLIFTFIITPMSWFLPDSFLRNVILFLLATGNYLVGGTFFLKGAYKSLKNKKGSPLI